MLLTVSEAHVFLQSCNDLLHGVREDQVEHSHPVPGEEREGLRRDCSGEGEGLTCPGGG